MVKESIPDNNNLDENIQKSPKMRDEALVDLERMIVNGLLEPGQWVSETYLIEVSGHSRASVRSAIQRLSDQGLLNIIPRRGAQVCPIDYTQQFRSLELRRAVETLVAKSAAKRASAKQREKFSEIANGFRLASQTKQQQVMTELDSEFFALMLRAADNSFAARALTSVKGLTRRFWVLHQEQYGDFGQMANTLADIADAISKSDQDLAEAAVGKLIDYVEKFTLEVVGFNRKEGETN
ncbi:GntR family transcriptional regulator [Cocleimonas flava]|uniref:GntR family transcriptional regulator n=1 Tax=Cocleimonas flava TaxID=634765 RepID=A0A4V2P7S7_9GAMM|nr:GntR family transcriptional regulator [Cocleimonas flava]TCJ83025.1 GntR family transcriptional regulator [Cocleimonas flava]